jgi:4-amino-4-deoxy-L-arabinose transferase-like glycosyltransferase
MHHHIAPGWLGALLVGALASAAIGQLLLVLRHDETMGVLAYAVSLAAFAYAYRGIQSGAPAGGPALGRPLKWGRQGLLAAAAAVLPFIAVKYVGMPGVSLPAWLGAMAAAVLAAIPRQTPLLALPGIAARRCAAWVQSREGVAALCLTAAAAGLRFFRLADFPSGIHGDETGFGLIAASVARGQGPNPFGTAFLGDAAIFVWAQAPFIKLFGQTVFAIRFLAALAGTLTVVAFYLLLRSMFGARVALIGMALLAGSAVHINLSRMGLNLPEPLLFCILALWALWEGQARRQPVWWLLSGLFGAFAVYFHFVGRLVPVIIGFFFVCLLISRRQQWRDWLLGAALSLSGGLIALAPMAVFQSSQIVAPLGGRVIFSNWTRAEQAQHTTEPALVILGQIKTSLLAFFSTADSAFYSFAGTPMLPALLAPLAALGLALMLAQVRQPRNAILLFTFAAALVVTGALTIDAPQDHRMLPAYVVALAAAAVFIDWLLDNLPKLLGASVAGLLPIAAWLVPVAAGYVDDAHYFGPAAAAKPYENVTTQARFVASLGPSYRVFDAGAPSVYFKHSNTAFLAPNVTGTDIQNPGLTIPEPTPADHNLAFLLYPHTLPYLPLLESAYPGGTTVQASGSAPSVITGYLVPADEAARHQGLTAHYPDAQRVETDTTHLGGAASSYPAGVSWTGSIYAERAGTYGFRARGAQPKLLIDGTEVKASADVSIGWHDLALSATVLDRDQPLGLLWQPPGDRFRQIPGEALWSTPVGGHLLGAVTPDGGATAYRRDRTVGFYNLGDALAFSPPAAISWQASLNGPAAGQYGFTVTGDGAFDLDIDGLPLAASAGEQRTVRAAVMLSSGPHAFQLRFRWERAPGFIEVLWQPPGLTAPTAIPPEMFQDAR